MLHYNFLSISYCLKVIRHISFGWDFPIPGKILRVLGPGDPQNLNCIDSNPPKGTSLGQAASFEPLHVEIGWQVFSNGVTEKRKKITNKSREISQATCIFHVPVGAPLFVRIQIKFGWLLELVDLITCTKFHGDHMKGFDPAGSQSLLFSIHRGSRP